MFIDAFGSEHLRQPSARRFRKLLGKSRERKGGVQEPGGDNSEDKRVYNVLKT